MRCAARSDGNGAGAARRIRHLWWPARTPAHPAEHPIAVGYILHWTSHNCVITFYVSAAIYFMGTFCWMFLDPVTPLDQPEPTRLDGSRRVPVF